MTDPAQSLVTRPSPDAALEATFGHIARHRMAGVPILNPALSVEAVGFSPWDEHWLGVLVTPWFMNLWLMPRVAARWQPITAGASRHYVFPAGVFEFIGGFESTIGDYQACSLFSPMFEFHDHAAARDTAVAALAALFDPAVRPVSDASALSGDKPDAAAAPAAAKSALSKRDFLFGGTARNPREP